MSAVICLFPYILVQYDYRLMVIFCYMSKYDHKKIEAKWKKNWEKSGIYKTGDPSFAKDSAGKPKYYVLDMFPYPSGAGLHVGHPKGFIATDIVARLKMMQGYNVLHPMGWDAFGLPAENYALKNKVHPADATAENIKVFKKQLGLLGFTYDWSREVNTTDPEYYKWTQWIFLQLFKKGLAFESYEPINWCPSCKTGLANEDLEDGKCERCGSVVEQKPLRQWVLKITDYAERLLNDIELLKEWPEPIKEMQRNWIGRKEGINIVYQIEGSDKKVICFTTRPDTNFGATFVVVGPEHSLISSITTSEYKEDVEKYVSAAKNKTELDRIAEGREKSGVFTGSYCINNLTDYKMPIWVADYVLGNVGTGMVVGVPGHDKRDFEFANKFGIEIKRVVVAGDGDTSPITKIEQVQEHEGEMINSGFLDGLDIHDATRKIMDRLEEKGWGKRVINYKLRDWVFSRQRYWGEPIPLVHCEVCKNKKYNYIILHGYTGTADQNGPGRGDSNNWRPWVKVKLEERGNKVFCPNLPNTNEPNIDEQVQYVIDNVNFEIDENTVIVGHSLGGVVIYKLLEKLNKKVGKVLLVDPVVSPEFPDKERLNVKKSCDWKFNFEKIKKLSDDFVVLGASDFATIFEKDLRFVADKLEANLVLAKPAEGHFTAEEEPVVLNLLNNTGWYPVPEKDLPLELPKVKNYEPTGTGESPLAGIDKWVNTLCPHCGGPAKRETNTMPQWAGSCWYYLRYEDPHNSKALVDKDKEKYWSPVDFYVGGAEHATRHLIYARFWHKFLFDIGAVSNIEPFTKLQSVGLILAEDGRKMSKRWNNVINPDDVVAEFGADAMRLYEMFMGPFDQACAWSTKGVIGCRRFLEKVWVLGEKIKDERLKINGDNNKNIEILLNQTIKKVTEDIPAMRFNTAIAQLMIFANEASQSSILNLQSFASFLQLLAPFAPHMTEELWANLGNKESIFKSAWPKFDPTKIQHSEITVVVQVNGKLRDEIIVPVDIAEADAKARALSTEKIKKWLDGKEPKKVIYVKGKLVSIVV